MPEPSASASQSSVLTLLPPAEAPGGPGPAGGSLPSEADNPDRGKADARGISPGPKCPYLAGRPPHGSYHLSPSGVNVCYARRGEEKPYGGVSKETQEARCFCGTEPYGRCPDYERAQKEEIPLPVFDGQAAEPPITAQENAPRRQVRRERVKGRHRHSLLRRWLKENGRSTAVCACWALLALVAFCLILRSM